MDRGSSWGAWWHWLADSETSTRWGGGEMRRIRPEVPLSSIHLLLQVLRCIQRPPTTPPYFHPPPLHYPSISHCAVPHVQYAPAALPASTSAPSLDAGRPWPPCTRHRGALLVSLLSPQSATAPPVHHAPAVLASSRRSAVHAPRALCTSKCPRSQLFPRCRHGRCPSPSRLSRCSHVGCNFRALALSPPAGGGLDLPGDMAIRRYDLELPSTMNLLALAPVRTRCGRCSAVPSTSLNRNRTAMTSRERLRACAAGWAGCQSRWHRAPVTQARCTGHRTKRPTIA